jgi:hypothetical protein
MTKKKKLVEYKQTNEHSDHYWGQCCSKTVSDLVNFSSNWWATLHLKGILLSSSWGYPLKHGYDRCYLIVALEWMSERCTPPRLTVGPYVLELNAHFTVWIWVITWTSLMMSRHFFPLSDLTSWEKSMRKNIEHTTMSLSLQAMRCMSGRLDNFHEDWW